MCGIIHGGPLGAGIDPQFAATLCTALDTLLGPNSRTTPTVGDLKHTFGQVVHAGCAVWGIRTFCAPLLRVQTRIAFLPHHYKQKLTAHEREAVQIMHQILQTTLGMRMVCGVALHPLELQTDARGHTFEARSDDASESAIGYYVDPTCYRRMTSSELTMVFHDAPPPDAAIAIFEAFAPLAFLRLEPERCRGQIINLRIDNTAAAAVMRRLRGPTQLDKPLREALQSVAEAVWFELTKLGARFGNIKLVPGSENELADAVSRGQWDRLWELIANT